MHLGALPIDKDANTVDASLKNLKIINALNMLLWAVIFSVKITYLISFRRLLKEIRSMEFWWWSVVIALVPAGLLCMTLSFSICPTFSKDVFCKLLESLCFLYLTMSSEMQP